MFTEQLTARRTSAEELENAIPVLALDLDSLKCVETKAVNFSDWGCKLVGEGLGILNKNIALKLEEEDEFQRGKVTGHKADYVTVLFQREVTPSMEKRGEPRYPVTVAARIRDLARKIEISCMITDASRSGCRVEGTDLSHLLDDLLVYVEGFERPVRGQVAWKEDLTAGLRLNWEGASALK
ncbi:PilZ domain-containing protein [Roseibium polysiphoniae]|uniref:PilZ domain-containing protein n=1 Tax=Roseibium polysiphoniae TaxID=2571221 RepID=UPI0032992F48